MGFRRHYNPVASYIHWQKSDLACHWTSLPSCAYFPSAKIYCYLISTFLYLVNRASISFASLSLLFCDPFVPCSLQVVQYFGCSSCQFCSWRLSDLEWARERSCALLWSCDSDKGRRFLRLDGSARWEVTPMPIWWAGLIFVDWYIPSVSFRVF